MRSVEQEDATDHGVIACIIESIRKGKGEKGEGLTHYLRSSLYQDLGIPYGKNIGIREGGGGGMLDSKAVEKIKGRGWYLFGFRNLGVLIYCDESGGEARERGRDMNMYRGRDR